jgi:hypothetical protein
MNTCRMNAWGSLALLPNELLVNIRCLSLARNHNNHTATAMGDTPLAVVPIKHRVIFVERVRSTVQRQLARSGTHACCFAMLRVVGCELSKGSVSAAEKQVCHNCMDRTIYMA